MDVVEAGPVERPQRGLTIGVVACLVLAAVAYGATRRDAAPPPRPTPTPGGTTPVARPGTRAPADPNRGAWPLPRPSERTGLALAGTAAELTVLDLDTGRKHVTAVGPRDVNSEVEVVTAIDGGWLVLKRRFCGDRGCPIPTLYAVRNGVARQVTFAVSAVADPDGRTVWVTSPANNENAFATPKRLERWTFDGSRVGPRTTLRGGENLFGATPAGPLVAREGRDLTLVDARTRARRVVLPSGRAWSVSGSEVAWTTPDCDPECVLVVTNVETGRERRVAPLPADVMIGALDRSARYVAVAFADERSIDAVRVYDVATGERIVVGGVTVPPLAGSLTWSPDGRWLVMTHARYVESTDMVDGYSVAVWRPGLDRAFGMKWYPGTTPGTFAVANAR